MTGLEAWLLRLGVRLGHARPHQAPGGDVPASRWHPSLRPRAAGARLRAGGGGPHGLAPGPRQLPGPVVAVGHGVVGERVAVRPEGSPDRVAVWLGPLRPTEFALLG